MTVHSIRRVLLKRPSLVHPAWFLLLATALATLPALLSTAAQRRSWGQFWILSSDDVLTQTLGFGCLALGLAISGSAATRPYLDFSDHQLDRIESLTRFLFWLSMLGYVVWFGLGLLQNGPSLFLGGTSGTEKVTTVPGLPSSSPK